MFARHVLATGIPHQLDDAVDAACTRGRDLLRAQPGYAGMAVFTDRKLGKLLVDSFWHSETSCRASDEGLQESRAKLLLPFSATLGVEIFEVAVMRQTREPSPGAVLRRMLADFDPIAEIPARIEAFRAIAPMLDLMHGFCRSNVFIDRARGRAVIGSIYADRDALEACRKAAAEIREQAGRHAGQSLPVRSLEEFDVTLDEAPAG